MSVPTLLDHVVVAGPDLGGLVEWFAERTGMVAAPGGLHPGGTANALVALTVAGRRGPHYVELIGPDPAASELPTRFGIDRLSEPRVVTYAVHPAEPEQALARARAHGVDAGALSDLSRRTPDGRLLRWRVARSPGPGPEVPFLIDWADTPHPGLDDDGGPTLELVGLERVEPDPAPVLRVLAALGLTPGQCATLVPGTPAGYRLRLGTPDGRVVTL